MRLSVSTDWIHRHLCGRLIVNTVIVYTTTVAILPVGLDVVVVVVVA